MTSKYNPKKTKEKILDVAQELFITLGYEDTSIQAIVEAIGMSKGAVFHHYKSKEEIFYSVIERQNKQAEVFFEELIATLKDLNGCEKITAILKLGIEAEEIHSLDEAISEKISDPRMVLTNMQTNVNVSSKIIARLIEEGNLDGSLNVKKPKESAEVFLLLVNTWCDPLIFFADIKKLKSRLYFTKETMDMLGLTVFTDELLNFYIEYLMLRNKKTEESENE